MYLAITTQPDIAYAAGGLARFNSNPGLAHWQAAKHVLWYLKGTMNHKLTYKPPSSPEPFITYCILMLILVETWTMAGPQVDMWSKLVLELFPGVPSFNH